MNKAAFEAWLAECETVVKAVGAKFSNVEPEFRVVLDKVLRPFHYFEEEWEKAHPNETEPDVMLRISGPGLDWQNRNLKKVGLTWVPERNWFAGSVPQADLAGVESYCKDAKLKVEIL